MEVEIVNFTNKTTTRGGLNYGYEMTYYIAPELPDSFTTEENYKQAEVIIDNQETMQSQIYSLGCVIYEMITLDGPVNENFKFKSENPFKLAQSNREKLATSSTMKMIMDMMHHDPKFRPTFQHIIKKI